MDAVFKALGDPTRRQLLDMLRERDGQTLTDLEQRLGMTRFGVMKHLTILEEASLVVTKRSGRFKHHYLNTVPIQEIGDRWIAPFAKPWARMVLALKSDLEGGGTMSRPAYVAQTYIRTTPEELWDALVKGKKTKEYFYATEVRSDFTPGAKIEYLSPDGSTAVDGEILEVDKPNRLVTTFRPLWEGPGANALKVVWIVEKIGETCRLTLEHHGLPEDSEIRSGWIRVLESLKSYLETGKGLDFAA
jgi:uncharacterized protein YndB with AHSA1/START domain/DNA-binding transcriptional ArsR family regulator